MPSSFLPHHSQALPLRIPGVICAFLLSRAVTAFCSAVQVRLPWQAFFLFHFFQLTAKRNQKLALEQIILNVKRLKE